MRPISAALMLILAGSLAAVYAGGGARGAATPDVPVKIQGAIALELQTLREESKGDLAGAEKKVGASRTLLQSTLPGLADSAYSAARYDVMQAEKYYDTAIKDLKRSTKKTLLPDAPLDIKIAINRKYGALEAFGFGRTFFNGTPPPVDAPPVVTSFKAVFDENTRATIYTVVASDPDDATLGYKWTNTNTCGRWVPNGPTSSWFHGPETDCPHNGTYHPSTITVTVSDKHSSCTVTDPNGSLPVDPYDPGEDCSKQPPPSFRAGADKATVQGLFNKVNDAVGWEDSADDAKSTSTFKEDALKSAEILKALQAYLTNLLSAFPKDVDIQSFYNLVHEAEELDRQAAAEVGDKKKEAHKALDKADLKKSAAQDIMESILKQRP